MPPSPWTGSRNTPTVLLVVACFTASTSLNGTWTKPSGSGVKGALYRSVPPAVIICSVRPWNAFCAAMISYAPCLCSLPHLRASLRAPSFASAPLFMK